MGILSGPDASLFPARPDGSNGASVSGYPWSVVSELQDVLRAIEEAGARGERMALATIVAVRGSTYRREGARLLVPAEGAPIGTISGGCLEGDVCQIAEDVMRDGSTRLLHYDLTADDEAVWGWGLGCNGVVDVFVEPAERAVEMAGAIRQAVDERRELAAVTVVEVPEGSGVAPGARMLVQPSGEAEGSLGAPDLDRRAVGASRAALHDGRTGLTDLGDGVRAFVEALVPPIRLLVCGAGHDAIPLVRYGAEMGWRVEVLDDRPAFLTAERFPQAAAFVQAEPADAAAAAGVDRRTYAVVMSHNFLRDKDYLRSFLGSGVAYLGMLGPRARLDRLLAELAREGPAPHDRDLDIVHSPAGLDLGAEGAEEIAWAIVAEILSVRNGRAGGFLRDRGTAPIHDRVGGDPAVADVPAAGA